MSSSQTRPTRTDILIPTDYSPCALAALRCAIAWNDKIPIRVHVYHRVAGMPIHWNDMSEGEQEDYTGVQNAIRTLHMKYRNWQTVLKDHEIPHKLVYSGGDLGENIQKYVEMEGIEYVFMGSHGRSVLEPKIGSNAIDVIRRLDIPVLIAKEYSRQFTPEHVVFASDFDASAKAAFKILLHILAPFQPEIHLLNIDKPAVFREPKFLVIDAMHDFQQLASDFETVLHFHPEVNVGRGILEYCDKVDANLIALAESGSTIFGSKRISKPLRYLVERSEQPIIFLQTKHKMPDG